MVQCSCRPICDIGAKGKRGRLAGMAGLNIGAGAECNFIFVFRALARDSILTTSFTFYEKNTNIGCECLLPTTYT